MQRCMPQSASSRMFRVARKEAPCKHAITVTSERYVKMLRNFLRPHLRSLWINMEEMWFQQDGATAHMARASMTVVRQMFPQHVVSRFGDVPWPPRSPDLSQIKSVRSKTSYSRRIESSHSRINCNCATRNVSKCDAEL